MVYRIALVRHGQSKFNLDKKFTGWTDVDLTETGKKEAIQAGELLRTEGFEFDLAFCSVLKRSIKTLSLILEELEQLWIPVEKSWRLNERHYGDLQEISKAETAKKFGEKQLQDWRRGYDSTPARKPAVICDAYASQAVVLLSVAEAACHAFNAWCKEPTMFDHAALEKGKDDARYPGKDRRYEAVDSSELPLTESLKQTIERVLPYWRSNVLPAVQAGKRCIIVGHGNSIRALVKILDDVTDEEIKSLEIPTGVPLVYELNEDMKPVRHFHVGTAQAFTRRLGVLGVNLQAERMLHAFVSRGLELRLQEIKYHAQGQDNAVESLTGISSKDSDAEVVDVSDVLFVFSGVRSITHIIASNKGKLQEDQILVAVTKDGGIDEYQDAAGKGVKVLQAISKDDMKWAKDKPVAARIALRKGSQASEMDRNIVKTIFESAGFAVVKEGSLDQT